MPRYARKAHNPVTVPRYLVNPVYGPTNAAGGSHMFVVLGPMAVDPRNYGSRTGKMSIPSLMNPLHERDPGGWVAGHLLNDNMGGSGVKRQNLTPLTQTANKQHAKLENRVKSMVVIARMFHEGNPEAKFWLGVEYTVKVSAKLFGNFAPYNHCASHIKVTGRPVKVDKKTKHRAPIHGFHELQQLAFHERRIENSDAHIL